MYITMSDLGFKPETETAFDIRERREVELFESRLPEAPVFETRLPKVPVFESRIPGYKVPGSVAPVAALTAGGGFNPMIVLAVLVGGAWLVSKW